MNLRKHPDEVCQWCKIPIWYGVKKEPTGWKVFYVCDGPDGCGREWYAGRIDQDDIRSDDEVFDRAADISPKENR